MYDFLVCSCFRPWEHYQCVLWISLARLAATRASVLRWSGARARGGGTYRFKGFDVFQKSSPTPPPPANLNFCISHLGTSSAYSATQRHRFVHGHVHILTPKPWGPHFCIFHLATSCAFSAIQRYRFVHGHVHILIPKPWGPHFCIFHLGTSSAFSATQRYRFVHGHVHILISKLCGPHFCIFHLGTSSAFSAIQHYRFGHGHVHILSAKPGWNLRLVARLGRNPGCPVGIYFCNARLER